MAKFVFVNVPLHAHINPTLPVIQELVARGHEVVYYLTDKYKAAIEATGAKFRGYQSQIEQASSDFQKHSHSLTVPILMVGETLVVMPQIFESIREEQPDCIVYDPFCFSAKFIAQMLHIPAAITRVTSVGHEGTRNFFKSRPIPQENLEMFQSFMTQLCERYPIQPFKITDIFLHSAALNIVFIPRSFQVGGESLGDEYVFVGPSIGPRVITVDFPFELLGEQPLIYITLGTVYNNNSDFFKMCMAAFADLPVQVVISTGRSVEELDLDPVPENFLIRSYVPQPAVMQRAQVYVGSGSITSTMEGIMKGVPMVHIPQSISQDGTAKRVAELGLGIMLEKESLTVESLRNAVMQVMNDPAYRARAQKIQQDAETSGGFQAAADALLQFIQSKQTVSQA